MAELPSNISQATSTDAINMYKGQKSLLIFIVGKSGRGKSTAIKFLNPATTHIINVLGKWFPFPGGSKYQETGDLKNLSILTDAGAIQRKLVDVARDEKVRDIVIDDAQYIMAIEFFDKALIKGYDKFSLMGRNFWQILMTATKLRSGIKVFALMHEDDFGSERVIKTLGKMLSDKGNPEGLSPIVLWSEMLIENNSRKYYFSTQTDGITTAKSPDGMFPTTIPNSLELVSRRIDEYYNGVSLAQSKLEFEV